MFYAGIGSRQTPEEILYDMRKIAYNLAQAGRILRSGGADGADSAFEAGCDKAGGQKEIFLPWKKFNKNPSPLFNTSPEAFAIAEKIHPAWSACSDGAKQCHARNVHQILGQNLDQPVSCVMCYTYNGQDVGGTGTAIKLARQRGIEIYNLWDEDLRADIVKESTLLLHI